MNDTSLAAYYVRPDGSDLNNGSANESKSAFLTIQRAVEAVLASPLTGSHAMICVAHGTYSAGIHLADLVPAKADPHGFRLEVLGDIDRPDKVVLEVFGSDAVHVSDGANILLTGLTLRTRKSGNLITATRRATVGHRHCVLDASASETISASRYAEVYASGPTSVTGGSMAFAHATTRSTISFSSQVLTFGSGVQFSHYLWGVNDATVRLDKSQIIGCAAGNISVHVNGVLNVSSVEGEWRGGTEPRVMEGGTIATGYLGRTV